MTLRTALSGLAVGATLALCASVAAPATAVSNGVHTPSAKVERHSAATTKAEQRHVKDYWTPEMMMSAVSVGTDEDTQQVAADADPPATGAAVQETAEARSGRVFFQVGGVNYACSGTATNSSNGDVVTTAGHCVTGGPGVFATNWAFVPAYENGTAPYGVWTAQALLTTPEWLSSGNWSYDVAFAVMNEDLAGRSLTDVVGGYPISFNQDRGLSYQVYGYPAGAPFNGETLWSCSGAAAESPYGLQNHGVECTMTAGSSGGGWITGGTLNSVTSLHIDQMPDQLWGTYFGSVVEAAFDTAATTP